MAYEKESQLEQVIRAIFYILAPISQITTHAGTMDIFTNAIAFEIKRIVEDDTDHNAKEQAARYTGTHWIITMGIVKYGNKEEYLQVRLPKAVWKQLNMETVEKFMEDPEDDDYIIVNVQEENAYELAMKLLDWMYENAPHVFNDIMLRPFYDQYAVVNTKILLDSFIKDRADALNIALPTEEQQWNSDLFKQPIFIAPEDVMLDLKTARRLQEELRDVVKELTFARDAKTIDKLFDQVGVIAQKYGIKRNTELWKSATKPYQKLTVLVYALKTLAIHSGIQIAANSFTNRNIQLIKSKTREKINTQKQNILTLESYTKYFNTFATRYEYLLSALSVGAILHVNKNREKFKITRSDYSHPLFRLFRELSSEKQQYSDEISLDELPSEVITDIQAAMSTIISGIFTFGDPGKAISVQTGKNVSAEIMYKDGRIMVMTTSGMPAAFNKIIVGRWISYKELTDLYRDNKILKLVKNEIKSEDTKRKIVEMLHLIATTAAALDLVHGNPKHLHIIADMLRDYSTASLRLIFKGKINDEQMFNKLINNIKSKLPQTQFDEKRLRSFAKSFLSDIDTKKQHINEEQFIQAFVNLIMYNEEPDFSQENPAFNMYMVSALYSFVGQLTLADAIARIQEGEDISTVYHKWFISDILHPIADAVKDRTSEFTFMGLSQEEIEVLSIMGSNYAVKNLNIEESLEVFRKYARNNEHKRAAIVVNKALAKMQGRKSLTISNFNRLNMQYFLAVANLTEAAITRGLMDEELAAVLLPVLTIGVSKAKAKKWAEEASRIYVARGKLLEMLMINALRTKNTGKKQANVETLNKFKSLVGGAFVARMLGYEDVGNKLWQQAEQIMQEYSIDKSTMDYIVGNIKAITGKVNERPALVQAIKKELTADKIIKDTQKGRDLATELVETGFAHYEKVINDLEKKLKEKDLQLNELQKDLYEILKLLAKPIIDRYLPLDTGLSEQQEIVAAYFIAKKRLSFDDNARKFCQMMDKYFDNVIEAHRGVVIDFLKKEKPNLFGNIQETAEQEEQENNFKWDFGDTL